MKQNNKNLQEASFRSAVSRAYYAIFHLARKKMKQSKLKSNPNYKLPSSGQIHSEVKKYWTNNSEGRKIHISEDVLIC